MKSGKLLPKTAATQRLVKLSPPLKPLKILNVALYRVFCISIYIQNKFDKIDI